MKKLKFLLPFILALAMALSIPFAAACKKDDKGNGGNGGNEDVDPPPVVTTEVLSISVNTANAKTEFYTGEAFNSSNLVVNAEVKRSDKNETETVNVTTLAKVNSAAYNRNKMGTYPIRVSYEGKSASYNVNVTEAKLNWIPDTDFKDLYLVGEELQDLKEHGRFEVETRRPGETVSTKTDVTGNVAIDTSDFDNQKEDSYSISATYRLPALGAGFTANYPVSTSVYTRVIRSREGLNVKLADGVDEIFNLSATTSTATIDPSKIVVKRVDAYGTELDTPLSSTDYSVKLFKEDKEVSADNLSGGVYTGLTGGVYQLWATAASLNDPNYRLEGFAVIVVADEVVSITANQNGYTSQALGLDVLSPHWTYTASYISGAQKQLITDDVSLLLFNTKTVGTRNAVVRYTDTNAAGVSKLVTCQVQYTITASSLTELPKETFIVKNVDDAANKFATITPSDSDGNGGVITDNKLFSITTQSEMRWTEANGSATSANSKWITDVSLLDGSVVEKFDAGLSQSAVTGVGEQTPSLTFKAKTDITLKAYLTFCNATYNSNRAGKLVATITHKNNTVTTREISGVGVAREVMTDVTFDLYEGDVLVITIKNEATGTGTLWLFGAEATGYKAV